jgi:SAM-dependent methyltransferase
MAGIKEKIKSYIPLSLGYFLRRKYLMMRGLYYSGSRYYCPICDKTYRKFFDGGFDLEVIIKMQIIGGGRRKAIICPGCASNDRDRLIHQLLMQHEFTQLVQGKILHIAPEPALYDWFLQHLKKPDQYHQGVKYHEGFYYRKHIQLMDIHEIPFPDNTFDLVICNHVLEHVDDDQKAMQEIKRVLKNGGKAILQVPWSPLLDQTIEDIHLQSDQERELKFGQFDHVRLYGNDYPDLLRIEGLEVTIYNLENLAISETLADKMSLNLKECIFVGTKRVN